MKTRKYAVTYTRPETLTSEQADVLTESESSGIALHDAVQVCVTNGVHATLSDEHGFARYYVNAKGEWKAA